MTILYLIGGMYLTIMGAVEGNDTALLAGVIFSVSATILTKIKERD